MIYRRLEYPDLISRQDLRQTSPGVQIYDRQFTNLVGNQTRHTSH
jgi:hypothetical protein